jgi:hypothetical protein
MEYDMKTVHGCIFIIPNPLVTVEDFTETSGNELARRASSVKGGMPLDGPLVQVLYTNEDCPDWRSMKWDAHPTLWKSIPYYLPISLFQGKKEGDHIKMTLQLDEGELEMDTELRQLGFQYDWAGPFEKALSNLVDRFGHVGI